MLSFMMLQAAVGGLLLEEARAMPPQALVAALLGRGRQVERVVVHPLPSEAHSMSISWVDIYSSEIAAPEPGFCERQYIFVNMVPADRSAGGSFTRTATRMRAFEPRETTQLRYVGAAPCHGVEDGFFSVVPPGRDTQVALVSRLAAARDRARGRAVLPFRVTCVDNGASPPPPPATPCDVGTARKWLASLPLERAGRVTLPTAAAGDGGEVELPVDDLFIDATITVEGGRTTAVALRRRAGVGALWPRFGARRRAATAEQ